MQRRPSRRSLDCDDEHIRRALFSSAPSRLKKGDYADETVTVTLSRSPLLIDIQKSSNLLTTKYRSIQRLNARHSVRGALGGQGQRGGRVESGHSEHGHTFLLGHVGAEFRLERVKRISDNRKPRKLSPYDKNQQLQTGRSRIEPSF